MTEDQTTFHVEFARLLVGLVANRATAEGLGPVGGFSYVATFLTLFMMTAAKDGQEEVVLDAIVEDVKGRLRAIKLSEMKVETQTKAN